jgi:hypothetical protein
MTHSYNTRYQKKVTMEAHPLYQQFLTMDFKTLCDQIKFIEAQPYWHRDDDVLRYAEHALDILRAKNDYRNTALMMRFLGYHEEVITSSPAYMKSAPSLSESLGMNDNPFA